MNQKRARAKRAQQNIDLPKWQPCLMVINFVTELSAENLGCVLRIAHENTIQEN